HGRGPVCNRLLDIVPPVAFQARAGKEHIAPPYAARIQAQMGAARRVAFNPGDQLRRIHSCSPAAPTATRDSNGASGCTPMRRKRLATIVEQTGAATRPP